MSYNPNIPSAGTKIRNTFNLIQENFKQINDLYGQNAGRDHVEFTNATAPNRGLHKQVTFVATRVDPALTNPQAMIYTKDRIVGADTYRSLFFAQKPNTAAQIVNQLTDLSYTSFVVAGGSGRFYVLPWGMNLYVGSGTSNAGVQAFPGPAVSVITALASCSGGSSDAAMTISIPAANQFNVTCAAGNFSYRFLILSTNVG